MAPVEVLMVSFASSSLSATRFYFLLLLLPLTPSWLALELVTCHAILKAACGFICRPLKHFRMSAIKLAKLYTNASSRSVLESTRPDSSEAVPQSLTKRLVS